MNQIDADNSRRNCGPPPSAPYRPHPPLSAPFRPVDLGSPGASPTLEPAAATAPSTAGRSRLLRQLLGLAPSTTQELAAILEVPTRWVQLGLWVLQEIGHVERTDRFIVTEGPYGRHECARIQLYLYQLTPQGRHYLARAEAHNAKTAKDARDEQP